MGGGPAGAAAGIAARTHGSAVHIIEKSKFRRHKVCGEFFSPEIGPELERLGAWDTFCAAGPARLSRMKLHFGRGEKNCPLPERAWGLSRYAFDALLLERAQSLGCCLDAPDSLPGDVPAPLIVSSGRKLTATKRGRRLFGFKAHFEGPTDDAVELFFFDGCYVGVNIVENRYTNVCGLGPEDFLRCYDFDYDRIVRKSPALAARLEPLSRSMKWLSTGPLHYGQTFDTNISRYFAGDALSFVDPFTGSGLLAAVKTGALAGAAAARSEPVARYIARCRASLKKPFEIASILRKAVDYSLGERLAMWVPGRLLFALTRPH